MKLSCNGTIMVRLGLWRSSKQSVALEGRGVSLDLELFGVVASVVVWRIGMLI